MKENCNYAKILENVRKEVEEHINSSCVYLCVLLYKYRSDNKKEYYVLKEWIRLILDRDRGERDPNCTTVNSVYRLKPGIEANSKRLELLDEMIEVLGEIPKHKYAERHELLRKLRLQAVHIVSKEERDTSMRKNCNYVEILENVRVVLNENLEKSSVYLCYLLVRCRNDYIHESRVLKEWIHLILANDSYPEHRKWTTVEAAYRLKPGIQANTKRLELIDEMIEVLHRIPRHKYTERHKLLRKLRLQAVHIVNMVQSKEVENV